MNYEVAIDGKTHQLKLSLVESGWSCSLDGENFDLDAVKIAPGILSLRVGSRVYEVRNERIGGNSYVWVGDWRFMVDVRDPKSLRGRMRAADDHGPKNLTAPMPGKVVRVLAQEGSAVEVGAGIVVVEAMKMQNEIKSPKKGTLRRILVAEGAAVNAGDVLAIVE